MSIRPLDRDALRDQFRTAKPFPFVAIDDFLEPAFADEVARSFPSYSRATELGHSFKAVNENLKVQVSDYAKLPAPMQRLSDAVSSPQFLADLAYVTGIPKLLWDPHLNGGGMHQTAASGHLDVHVDFNRIEASGWFRRLNILVYFNPVWEDAWGGLLELWDDQVKQRHHAFSPVHNRCVIFETSEISYHGVTAVTCPSTLARKSFAAYYYTAEAPTSYAGVDHTTIFKARPDELLKGLVLMPAIKLRREAFDRYRSAKKVIKGLIRPSRG
jgi:hypothetical protein